MKAAAMPVIRIVDKNNNSKGEAMRTFLPTILTIVMVSSSLGQGPGALREGRQRPGADARRSRDTRREQVALEPKATTGLIPLTDMRADASYRGEDGGLYGQGRNTPPEALLNRAMAAAGQIQPLDAQGAPSPDGRIVMVSAGMSNTRMKFAAFQSLLAAESERHPALVAINGAQGGRHASTWQGDMVWNVVHQQLDNAGVTPAQVQVMWMLHAIAGPSVHGTFPAHAQRLEEFMAAAVRQATARYPNLKLIYFSSRTYAGYATRGLNPEPYAYESSYAVRWLIQNHMAQTDTHADPAKGATGACVLLWGPYLWADGEKGRITDPMVWLRQDYAGDGTHPSAIGNQKVAERMLTFFKTDPTARNWFLRTDP